MTHPTAAAHWAAIIDDARANAASAIHFEPDERGFTLRIRIDGRLHDRGKASREEGLEFLEHALLALNIRHEGQTMPVLDTFTSSQSTIIDGELVLTGQLVPALDAPHLVVRIEARSAPDVTLARLGPFATIPADASIHDTLDTPQGVVLIGGDDDAQCRELVAACVRDLAPERKVITVGERPTRPVRGNKIVPRPTGGGIDQSIKEAMRLDADVIVVEQPHDAACARRCAQAAFKGHLVLACFAGWHQPPRAALVQSFIDDGVGLSSGRRLLLGTLAARRTETGIKRIWQVDEGWDTGSLHELIG